MQRQPEVVVQFDRIGPVTQCPIETGDRLFMASQIETRIAEIVEGIDGVRREGEGALVAFQRFGSAAQCSQYIAEVVVERGIPSVSRDRLADVLDRLIGSAG